MVPEQFKKWQVIANIALPRLSQQKEKTPKHRTFNIEAMWLYKHAWRGAGHYRKGDHQTDHQASKDKPEPVHKALNMYPIWEKWIMPRIEPVSGQFYNNQEKWSLDDNYDSVKGLTSF